MIVIPAVDIKGGEAVRLLQGRRGDESLRAGSPLTAANKWAAYSPKRLHVVDLDGAFDGESQNVEIVKSIIKSMAAQNVEVEIGGGIRTHADVKKYIDAGAARVIMGTRACEEPEFLIELAQEFSGKISLGLDCDGGKVAVRGWVKKSELTAVELLNKLKGVPLGEVIYTDIATDGMLSGPSIEATRELVEHSPYPVIASGGVASLEDLLALSAQNCFYGAIVGRAIYDGKVDLAVAIEQVEERAAE